LLDELVAVINVVEDLITQHEEAAVDPKVGVAQHAETGDVAELVESCRMETLPCSNGNEAYDRVCVRKSSIIESIGTSDRPSL
jgi:hypothetical protein